MTHHAPITAALGWICPRCDRAHAPTVSACDCHTPAARGQVAQIIAATAAEFGVSAADITGQSRRRGIVAARHAAMWLARAVTDRSTTEVGMAFRRDHTSVMHACAKIDRAEPEMRAAIGRVRARLAPEEARVAFVAANMDRAQIAALGRAGA